MEVSVDYDGAIAVAVAVSHARLVHMVVVHPPPIPARSYKPMWTT